MKTKLTRKDLKIVEGKINVKTLLLGDKKINLTPVPHAVVENYITHENCSCGVEFEKRYTYQKLCAKCESKKIQESYYSLELVEWDEKTPLYEYDSTDKYIFGLESIIDYAEELEIKIEDLNLVLCERSNFSAISLDTITGDGELVYEDWEPSKEFEEKLKEFNDWLTNQSTSTWFPTNKRVTISKT